MAQPLTVIHRITNAVTKIGLVNGTKIPEPEYSGEDKSNSARDAWYARWAAVTEYLIANTVKKVAEKREETAKKKLKTAFGPEIAKLSPGHKLMQQYGNVGIVFDRRNAAHHITRASVITTLTTEYKWKLEEVEALLKKIEVAGESPLYITTSTTAE